MQLCRVRCHAKTELTNLDVDAWPEKGVDPLEVSKRIPSVVEEPVCEKVNESACTVEHRNAERGSRVGRAVSSSIESGFG